MATALVDELMEGYDNKYLLIGFDVNMNLIEVMYNLVDDDISRNFVSCSILMCGYSAALFIKLANVFHAMKCRKALLGKIKEGGHYADFD